MGGEAEAEVGGVHLRRFSAEEIPSLFPKLQHEGEVITYDSCFSVELGKVLGHLAHEQERAGNRVTTEIQLVSHDHRGWVLHGESERYTCDTLILASGSRLQEWLPELQGEVEGGHLLTLRGAETEWMASRGDIHWSPSPDGAVVGATRWKANEKAMLSEEATGILGDRGQSLVTFPVEAGVLWQGERMGSAGERYPYAGAIPGSPFAYVLGGLGSKGLLYGPWSAESLAAHLTSSTPIHAALSPQFTRGGQEIAISSVLGS